MVASFFFFPDFFFFLAAHGLTIELGKFVFVFASHIRPATASKSLVNPKKGRLQKRRVNFEEPTAELPRKRLLIVAPVATT